MINNLIKQIQNWGDLTPQEIVDILNAQTIEKIDNQLYTWAGVALIVGTNGAEAFRVALEQNGLGWVVHQLGGSGIQLSNPLVQQVLLGFAQNGVSGAQDLALIGKRNISLVESVGLPIATLEGVQIALEQIQAEIDSVRLVNAKALFNERMTVSSDASTVWAQAWEDAGA